MESAGQAGPRMKGTGERDYSFLFTKARFGGTQGIPFRGNGSDNPGGNGSRKNSDRRNPEHPGNQGNRDSAGGPPDGRDPDDDDDGDNGDDSDEYNDSSAPSIDRHPLAVRKNPE